MWLASETVGHAAWIAGRLQRAWWDRDRRRHVAEMRARELAADENRLRREAYELTAGMIERELLSEDLERAAAEAEPWGLGEIGELAIAIGRLPEKEPRRNLAW